MSAAPKYIPAEEVEKYLKPKELLPVIESALGNFSRGPDGGVVQPVRSVISIDKHKGFLSVMAAYSSNDNALATKLIQFYPEVQDGPTHQGQLLLFNPCNGSLQAIIDGEAITAVRTAIASAVATKHLANPNSKVLAILGAGIQATSHYEALKLLHHFDEVRVWSRTFARAQAFAKTVENGKPCMTAEECVKDADIIVTVTFSMTPVLQADWVKPGAHINAVGACRPDWQEIDSKLMREAVLYVDSRDACLAESGDVILSQAEIYAEIGEVIIGQQQAHWEKTTLFKSVGVAVEDVVSAKMVYDKYLAANEPEST